MDNIQKKKFIKAYYQQLPYENKLGNLEERHKFLEAYNFTKLIHEDIENPNSQKPKSLV